MFAAHVHHCCHTQLKQLTLVTPINRTDRQAVLLRSCGPHFTTLDRYMTGDILFAQTVEHTAEAIRCITNDTTHLKIHPTADIVYERYGSCG